MGTYYATVVTILFCLAVVYEQTAQRKQAYLHTIIMVFDDLGYVI